MTGKNIFGALVVAIALFFFWPAVIGTWQEVGALRDARDQRAQLLESRTEILTDTQAAYAEYQQNVSSADGEKFAALVPVRKNTAELLSAIQEIGSATGVSVGEVRMSEPSRGGTGQFQTLNFTFNLSGSYTSLRQFLGNLEQYVRLLNITSIDATADSRQFGLVRFVVQGDAYFLK